MAPFAAAPALKKHLKPDTQFLRVDDKEDGDNFYTKVQAAFTMQSPLLLRNVIVVGGDDPKEAWRKVDKAVGTVTRKEKPLKSTAGDVVYILAKSSQALIDHASSARKRYQHIEVQIVGHIDVDKLAVNFPLQTDTSYERTVGDICRAVLPTDNDPEQKKADADPKDPTMLETLLGKNGLDHLIIRIGNSACLVASPADKTLPKSNGTEKPSDDQAQSADKSPFVLKLFCHPDRSAPTTFPGLGSMLAYDLLLCAAVVRQMALTNVKKAKDVADFELNPLSEKQKNKAEEDRKAEKVTRATPESSVKKVEQSYADILEGARIGVQATYRCFIEGFGIFDSKQETKKEDLVNLQPDAFFAKFIRHGIWAQTPPPPTQTPTQTQGKNEQFKPSELQYPEQKPDAAVKEPPAKMTMGFEVHYETARSPNKFWRMVVPDEGGSKDQNCLNVGNDYLLHGKDLPLVDLGSLQLVDRQEVEDYLYLQRLLLTYHDDAERRRPLCIGVFGQPGAGKSIGVKQLVNEMSGNSGAFSKDSITVNLSQLRSLDELAECFHLVRDACLKPPIPLVFFDEFDSSFEDRTFGWLKYFLAPMQDGEFFSKGKNYHFGKAIFVFAGGVNHSFAEFNERSRNPDFCDAKGPDFISRLRGILNICSMNKPEGEPDTVEHIYRIRRAVFLKYLLEKRLGKLKDLIAPTLAKAFLTIPRYKHGARSLEAILEMSTFPRDQPFTHSNLPPRDQLDMHVDAREFLRLAGVLTPLSKS